MFVFKHFLFITTGGRRVCSAMLQTEDGSKLQLQCKMGSDKVSIKEDPFAIYIGVFRRSSSEAAPGRKCICKLNPWEEMTTFGRPWIAMYVVTTTLLIAVGPLKSRSPRVITASLKFSSLYVYKDIFSPPRGFEYSKSNILFDNGLRSIVHLLLSSKLWFG